jgi:hypothetical protein
LSKRSTFWIERGLAVKSLIRDLLDARDGLTVAVLDVDTVSDDSELPGA